MSSSRQVIGIDASRAVGRVRTGTENYSAQLIRAMLQEPAEFDWRLYFNGNSTDLNLPDGDGIDVRDIPSRRLWTHLRLSRELFQNRISGLFVPSHVIPLYHPPSVVTIHDLGYLHWPEAHPKSQVRMLDLTTRWSAKVARHIIVPSQVTADDLQFAYGVDPAKITVVHHGIDPSMTNLPDETDIDLRARYGLPEPYVLAVGTMQPRKNLGVLARAMKQVIRNRNVSLVIAGRRGWMYEQVARDLLEADLGDRLVILDYVPSEDLPALYRNAEVFAQPSRFEGFGMPILEAMASGTPVVAARGSSLDEIGGDAAIRFDHEDVDELAHAIGHLLDDSAASTGAVETGLAWSSGFTWQQTARKTRIILEENLIN